LFITVKTALSGYFDFKYIMRQKSGNPAKIKKLLDFLNCRIYFCRMKILRKIDLLIIEEFYAIYHE